MFSLLHRRRDRGKDVGDDGFLWMVSVPWHGAILGILVLGGILGFEDLD